MIEKIYAEAGFGNESFFSTEIEKGKREFRIKGFVLPKKFRDVYLRFWIFRRTFIISSCDGFVFGKKGKNKFKFLFGIGGFGR